MNHQEVVEEDKRLKLPANWEAKKARLEWELQEEERKKVRLYSAVSISCLSSSSLVSRVQTMILSTGSGARLPKSTWRLGFLLGAALWGSYLTSLCLCFLICEMETK